MTESSERPLDAHPSGPLLDVVAGLRARHGRAHGAERRLIETLFDEPSFAVSASISEIAARAGVSEPTITRLAKALGLRGTKELKLRLAQALAIGGAHLRVQRAGRPDPEGPDPGVLGRVCSGAHSALELMSLALVEFDLQGFTAPLVAADQVLVYGTGGTSSMAAVETQNRLFRLGLHVTAHTDPQLQRMSASVVSEDSVIVGYSLSGQVRSVRDALAIGRQYGARTLAVTAPDSALAALADMTLPLALREDRDLYMPSSAKYAMLVAVDAVATSVAEQIGPEVIERTRRVRQSLADQNLGDPALPIGD